MKGKILSIGIMAILISAIVPITETNAETAQNTIDIEIYGGFGIKVVVKNLGDVNLSNLDWKIDLSGLIFTVGSGEGVFISLPGGDVELTIKLFVLGIGPGKIGVTVENVSKTADILALGPFVIVK